MLFSLDKIFPKEEQLVVFPSSLDPMRATVFWGDRQRDHVSFVVKEALENVTERATKKVERDEVFNFDESLIIPIDCISKWNKDTGRKDVICYKVIKVTSKETGLYLPRKIATRGVRLVERATGTKFETIYQISNLPERVFDSVLEIFRKFGEEIRDGPRIFRINEQKIRESLEQTARDIRIEVRDYQLEAVIKIILYFLMNTGATLKAPTGSGKTEMALLLIRFFKDYINPDFKVTVIATKRDLVEQFIERAKRFDLRGSVNSASSNVDIMGVTVQTLVRRISNENDPISKFFKNSDLVIVDEAHHVPANSITKVLNWLYEKSNNLPVFSLGLSATPWRTDHKTLKIYELVGDLVEINITSKELSERGHLVLPKIYVCKFNWSHCSAELERTVEDLIEEINDDEQNVKKIYYEYMKLINLSGCKLSYFADLIQRLVEKGKTPILVLFRRKNAVKLLGSILKNRGIRTEIVTGDVQGRQSIYDKIRRGELDVLVATSEIAEEGLDIPNLRVLIVFAGGKSTTKTLQKIGRVMRKFANKKEALVIDVVDVFPENTFVEKKFNKYSSSHTKNRITQYKNEGLDVEKIDCDSLF